MLKIIKGTKFFICIETLMENGWVYYEGGDLYHKDWPGNHVTKYMMQENEFKILTVKDGVSWKNQSSWYGVEENFYDWPVAAFFVGEFCAQQSQPHICIEGMTPIDGWVICKNCGTNLKEIK